MPPFPGAADTSDVSEVSDATDTTDTADATAPSDALAELHRIIDGTGPPRLRERLAEALAADASEPSGAADTKPSLTHRQLRALAQALPSPWELCENPEALVTLNEQVALADPVLCMAVINHYVLCLNSVLSLSADPAALASEVEDLGAGRTKGTYLVTEIGEAGSHLCPRTTAEFDPTRREFVLRTPDSGAAKFSGVGRTRTPQSAVVVARLLAGGTDRGVFSFLVDLSDASGPAPGVELSDVLAVRDLPVSSALVRFDGVRLPYERWLGDGATIDAEGVFHDPLPSPEARHQRTLHVGRTLWGTLPTAMAAMARTCAVRALRHAAHRSSHGRLAPGSPVLAYRPQQHALLGALAESFALTCAGNAAREMWLRTMEDPHRTATGAGAESAFAPWASVDAALAVHKVLAVDGAARVTAECQHRSGLGGFLEINGLPGYRGFAHSFVSAGGDNRLIMLDTGRSLAEQPPPEQPPSGRGVSGSPVTEPVDSPDWWPAVAAALEHDLTTRLHHELKDREKLGLSAFELWNPLLEHARELGEAHADQLAATAVARTLADVGSPELRAALEPLAALYGTLQAGRQAGALLASGVLTPETVRSLAQVRDRLCDRVRSHLPLLEAAMAPPERSGTAPLGRPKYAEALAGSLGWHRGGAA
ncbi:acyl-CoA dehydrogenase family protein [Streptomyces sp. NPDC054796]